MRAPFSRTLYELLAEKAETAPDAIATIAEGREVTYASLRSRSAKIGAALRRDGVRRGDRVALIAPNGVDWLTACFGVAMAGGVLVPVSTWSRPSEIEFVIRDSQAAFLLTVGQFGRQDFAADLATLIPELADAQARSGLRVNMFPALRGVVLLSGTRPTPAGLMDFAEWIAGTDAELQLPPGEGARAGDDAYLLFTSGSTAYPKAVRLPHYMVIENGFNIGERQGLQAGDRVFLPTPLFWSYGAANALPATLTHGATLVLQPRFEASEALALIERHACTAIYTLPGITTALMRAPDFGRSRTQTLRTGLTIGTAQDIRNAAEGLGVAGICNIYGASETCGNCCVTDTGWPLADKAESQGKPLPGFEIRIVDAEGEPIPAGNAGLVEVQGYVTPGYSGTSSALNSATFTADGYFRTGDLGYLAEDGRFVFLGRQTEMIKKGGINISPAEVEEIIARHPAVAAAGVVGLPDAEHGEVVVAFVVAKESREVRDTEIVAHCRQIASAYKVPDRIFFCGDLPTTVTGKLMRSELRKMALAIGAANQGSAN